VFDFSHKENAGDIFDQRAIRNRQKRLERYS